MQEIRDVGVLSVGIVFGLIYLFFGLLIGLLFAAIGMFGGAMMTGDDVGGPPGVFFGLGAVIIFPILYGVMGFVGGMIMALVYNLVASWTGGIKINLVSEM